MEQININSKSGTSEAIWANKEQVHLEAAVLIIRNRGQDDYTIYPYYLQENGSTYDDDGIQCTQVQNKQTGKFLLVTLISVRKLQKKSIGIKISWFTDCYISAS